ncbi:MAG: hypothetical protein ACYC6N_00740 [Pirellulaceae bacterium]
MRVAAFGLGVLAVLGVVFSGVSLDPRAWAQTPPQPTAQPVLPARTPLAAAGDLMAFSSEVGNGPAQVTLIDVKSRVMCVYHVDRTTGQIELKSVRNVHWDLLMEEFNGVRPLPREIRALLEQQ